MRGFLNRYLLSAIAALCISSTMAVIKDSSALSLSGSEFNAGRIIEDSLFYDGEALTTQQIQEFLNSKVPSCDTQGTAGPYYDKYGNRWNTRADYGRAKGSPPPYTCLKDHRQSTSYKAGESGLCSAIEAKSNRSAAQIIDDVSRACHISQKVLLVLLQKEQGFITDDWPWPIQYTKATGFYCPDDPARPGWCHPDYAGFFNQVYNAALQFQKYKADPNNWNHVPFMTNQVKYQENAPSCGVRSVYIENYATAGLYNYTPYTPNQAALNNLYGTGDGCSAYGNRNFWRYYTDWFGPTLGSLIRTESSGALYLQDSGMRFKIPSMELAAQFNLTAKDVRFVSQAHLDSIPLASTPFSHTLGHVVKSENDSDADGGSLYLVSNGKRFPIGDMNQFAEFGFTASSITYLPLSVISRIPISSKNLSYFIQSPDGSLAKVESSKKRAIFELSKLQQSNPTGSLSALSSFTFNQWSYSRPLIDGSYVIIGPDSGVRLYAESGSYLPIPSMDYYECLGLAKIKRFKVASYATTNGISADKPASCIMKDSTQAHYLMAESIKIPLPGYSPQSPAPALATDHAQAVPTVILNGKPVKSKADPAVATIEQNQLRHFISADSFNRLGYRWSDITALPARSFKSLSTGPALIAPGSVVITPDKAVSVISSSTGRMAVPSMTLFAHYSYDEAPTYRVPLAALDTYPQTAVLSHLIRTASGTFLVDKGVRYLIPEDVDSALGINRQNIPITDFAVVKHTTLPWNMSVFIKASNNPAVYKLENGKRRPIASWNTFLRESNNKPDTLVVISPEATNRFSLGEVLR